MKTPQHLNLRLAAMLFLATAVVMPQTALAVGTQPLGSGTTSNPYQIATADHLLWFAEQVNSGYITICANLTANIVLNQEVLDDDGNLNGNGSGFIPWTPIGFDEDDKKYEGTFDGQGHTVSGLYFKDRTKSVVGFFTATGTNGIIRNVGVIDSYLEADTYVSGICGRNGGLVENCFNAATCKMSIRMSGGLVSWNAGVIRNCYNVGLINLGAGVCYNTKEGTITNCYTLDSSCDRGLGVYFYSGVPPVFKKTEAQFTSGEVAWLLNCSTAEGDVIWYQNLGAEGDAYPVLDSTHSRVYSGYDACTRIYANHPIAETEIHHIYDNGFCTICGEYEPPTLNGGWYEIANAGQLFWFSNRVNSGGYNKIRAKLTSDILLNQEVLDDDGHLNGDGTGFTEWIPIGLLDEKSRFQGVFDGQGHSVSGLYVKDSEKKQVGLFGVIDNGQVKNVEVLDSYFYAATYVGGLCGESKIGKISNCHNAATVVACGNSSPFAGGVCAVNYCGDISNCYNTGIIQVETNAEYADYGGLSGYNFRGTISNCYNAAPIDVDSPLSHHHVGGVIGSNDGTISFCYNMADLTVDVDSSSVGGVCGYNLRDITCCYNTGLISANENDSWCGSVCGWNLGGSMLNNYFLEGTADVGVEKGGTIASVVVRGMNASQFACGEVTWLLNGSEAGEDPAWRQTIGEDEYPVLDAAKGIVIYSTQTGLNSVIRPTAGTLVGALDVYNFAGIDGIKVYGIQQTGTLAAEHPYVFTTLQNYVSFVPSDEAVIDNTETCGLTGVLDPAGLKVYGNDDSDDTPVSIVFTADALRYANANGNQVKYGKCYVKASEAFVSSVPLMASPLPAALEGVTTGIDALEAPKADGKCYNLMGIEVGEDYRGIVIQNGKKTLRR